MARTFFYQGIKAAGALGVLLSASMLITSCDNAPGGPAGGHQGGGNDAPKGGEVPLSGGRSTDLGPVTPEVPAPGYAGLGLTAIELMARTNPIDPINERFLDDWRFEVVSIDDQARPTSPVYYGDTDPSGNGVVLLPSYMLGLPLVVNAYNDVLPLFERDEDDEDENGNSEDDDDGLEGDGLECRSFEIFIPPNCYDKAVWLVGPVEDALWDYYGEAAEHRAEAWNPYQVDCATWLANLQQLILTDRIDDELHEMNDTQRMIFDEFALTEAFQENQQLLVPTRPPICMAELRHNGGGMERGEEFEEDDFPIDIDNDVDPWADESEVERDHDPILIGANGIVTTICNIDLAASEALNVNGNTFTPDNSWVLDDEDFMGTVHDEDQIGGLELDISVFNVKNGDGYPLDHDKYDDACSLTSIVEFDNTDDDEQDLNTGTGVTFTDLFGVDETDVWRTSDGDDEVHDNDTWAIFFDDTNRVRGHEKVMTVEFLGYRSEDFRDVLEMTFDDETENLFLGLRADYDLNEEEVDGERAFMGYTITIWDGSTDEGLENVRDNIANCYEAADPWARQFFVTQDFQDRAEDCCIDEECDIEDTISPLRAAEFAVRSQCFSNSRSNARWETEDVGFWSLNTIHGVAGNVVVNPGWLGPDLDFEIYIQKFDEAVFKGPRLISRTDRYGQLMAAVPTLVEGDRVLIKAEDNCCSDYKIALPCVPEFTGFAGIPGVPYVPQVLGPPPGTVPVPPPAN